MCIRDRGKTVTYCLLTAGEAGIDALPPDQCARIRMEEERRSAAVVGVDTVEFLGHPDGLVEVAHDVTQQLTIRRGGVVDLPGDHHAPGATDDHLPLCITHVQRPADPVLFGVTGLVAQGLTNKEIAAHLSVGAETVRSHLAEAFAKSGAKSRAELVTLAVAAIFGTYERRCFWSAESRNALTPCSAAAMSGECPAA